VHPTLYTDMYSLTNLCLHSAAVWSDLLDEDSLLAWAEERESMCMRGQVSELQRKLVKQTSVQQFIVWLREQDDDDDSDEEDDDDDDDDDDDA
jgi:hypothetical protein